MDLGDIGTLVVINILTGWSGPLVVLDGYHIHKMNPCALSTMVAHAVARAKYARVSMKWAIWYDLFALASIDFESGRLCGSNGDALSMLVTE